MKKDTKKKNLRRVSVVITAQTKSNLEHLAAVCGYNGIGQVIDKLTREKMISFKNWQENGGLRHETDCLFE